MPSESFFYLTGIFLLFGILVYFYFNIFETENKNVVNPNYLKGLKYLLDEESDKAINLFSDLIEIDEETIQTHLALGVLFRKQGRFDKAIQLHEYILSKDDLAEYHYFQTLFELGENYFSAGIYNKAEEIFLMLKDVDDHAEDALNKLIIINEYYGEWKNALLFLEEVDELSDQNLSVSRNHYYCEIAENYINDGDIKSAKKFLLKAQGLHTESIRSEYIKALIDIENNNIGSALASYEPMANKNPITHIILLPRIIKSSTNRTEILIETKLNQMIDSNPDISIYLSILAVTMPNIKNKVIDKVVRDFIQNQDIVREIDKLDENYSIISKLSNDLTQRMCLILNKKTKSEYKFNCTKCGYQTISFSWQCPTCKNWESSKPINFLKTI
jgi:lipopolysaccharide biosynthesis regulator YciM